MKVTEGAISLKRRPHLEEKGLTRAVEFVAGFPRLVHIGTKDLEKSKMPGSVLWVERGRDS